MVSAYLNTIATAVPDHDIHRKFVSFGSRLLPDIAGRQLFDRMARRAQIDHRFSFLQPHSDPELLDTENFYRTGNFPDTQARMKLYERHAFTLAKRALDQVNLDGITHLLVTTCTGFYAPGVDLQIIDHYRLPASIERTVIGFMGCYAALNALKLARHIVRSDRKARVAILNLELCTLHLKQSATLEEMLSFLIFSDGCSASIVSAEEQGLELRKFDTTLIPDSGDQITWQIGGLGFDMNLSGRVPGSISASLPSGVDAMLDGHDRNDMAFWAIHPGGRSILDAVRDAIGLDDSHLSNSRDILRRFGNMSSATIMFVLKAILQNPGRGGLGCGMAFGPGLTVESMCFQAQGK